MSRHGAVSPIAPNMALGDPRAWTSWRVSEYAGAVASIYLVKGLIRHGTVFRDSNLVVFGSEDLFETSEMVARAPSNKAALSTFMSQRDGVIGAEHVRVIRRFFHQLPESVDIETREHAEKQLALKAGEFRPDQLDKLARRLMDCLNPDGSYTDEDRARVRGLMLGNQQADGMSRLSGWLTPEARATFEAVLAKLAAPGVANPADDAPVVDGAPSQEAVQRDTRTPFQRNHDGLNAALRAMLASGKLGQHNGLPASIIVTTTLNELEAAAGRGLTGGGTVLPISDVIRLARHAHQYLAIFDKGKALALYHTKRLASPGQRIVLYAKDRGCSHPGCDVSGYYCEVHHVTSYATCPSTDIDTLPPYHWST